MTLPAPNLDDRRFQQLVDEAKRYVQQNCPEWTDHNVSDPGVTLIETFASMVDQLIYRLNRVPDRNYIKFLELIGLRLFPPTAARADVTFWLSSPTAEAVKIPRGTQVATLRTEVDEAVTFTVVEELSIVPSSLSRVASSIKEGEIRDHTTALQGGKEFLCFDEAPKVGDELLVGLSDATPRCAVTLRFNCEIDGVGVDPSNPPVVWEARCGKEWVACEVSRDETGGLNKAGDVIVHVPAGHSAEVINRQRAGWLRCRIIEAEEGQPAYSASPEIITLTAFTVGGTALALHAQIVESEILGMSEGVSGQRFNLRHAPVVAGEEPAFLEVGGDGWSEWTQVGNFADSGPDDKHFVLDSVTGQVEFGPSVRDPSGTVRQYGAVPDKDSPIRIRSYLAGGGRAGDVAKGSITILANSIPFVSTIENRHAAGGGVDGEDLESAKIRGPIVFRTRNRAVTIEDYAYLAREAAPEVARVECVSAGDGADAGAVRVLVVPTAPDDELGRLHFEDLVPSPETLEKISRHLDERRTIGARVVVEPPVYQGITVVARLRARPRANAQRLQNDALEALFRYFHPISGGPDDDGWHFGRPVHIGEAYSVFQRLRGVEFVEDARLFAADPITGSRGEAVQSIEIGPHALVFSFEHQVLVEEV